MVDVYKNQCFQQIPDSIEPNLEHLILKMRNRFVNSICESLSALSLHFKFRSMLQTFGLLPESTQLLKRESSHKKNFRFPQFPLPLLFAVKTVRPTIRKKAVAAVCSVLPKLCLRKQGERYIFMTRRCW